MGVVAKNMDAKEFIAKSLLAALLLVSQVGIIPAGPWRMGKRPQLPQGSERSRLDTALGTHWLLY